MNDKVLVLVESPVKAHTIQNYLGDDYIVLASAGHVCDLAKGGKNNLGIDVENGFIPKYVLSADKVEILDKILNAAKLCNKILIATDGDREGAAICIHLSRYLKDLDKPMTRMVFNKIDKKTILKSIQNTIPLDSSTLQSQFRSQEARRFLDRIVGFTASTFLQRCFIAEDSKKLSAGRCQSAIVKIITNRENEIKNFVPETFFTIQTKLSKDNKESFIAKYPNKLADEKEAKEIYKILSDKNAEYIVSEVLVQDEKKYPPAPLTTSTLQQLMAKSGISSDKTAKASQSLYECGYISYIRTDSTRMSDDTIEETRRFLVDNGYSVPVKPNTYKNSDQAQDAHECIHVLDLSLNPDENYAIIDPIEKAVYKTVFQYHISSQLQPAVFSTLRATLYIKGNKNIEVKASGKALKEDSKGFLEILGNNNISEKIDIPDLCVGDVFHLLNKPKLEKKQTQPPPRYSEENLLKSLKTNNIARPATYSELISKVCARNYLEKKGNVFYPTKLGIEITNKLMEYFTFTNIDYTAKMEEQLDLIEQGKLNHVQMLTDFYTTYKQELDKAYLAHGASLCEKCKNPMREITTKTGNKFLGCTNYPRCNFTKHVEN
jgi:DNA topoisomerase-1